MGQNSSRSLIYGPTDVPDSSHPFGSVAYNLLDASTNAAIIVNQPVLVPQSEDGHPLYNVYISRISTPFQITMWGDPFADTYIISTVRDSFDMSLLYLEGEGKYMAYTYLYSITGWTAFDGINPTTANENCIMTCPVGSLCKTDTLPNTRIQQQGEGSFKIITMCENGNQEMSNLNFNTCNPYIFIQSQARKLADVMQASTQPTGLSKFNAYFNAYLMVVSQIELYIGVNPFCCVLPSAYHSLYDSVLWLQCTYPYMVYAQLIIMESWGAIDRKWWSIIQMAVDFVSLYARRIWTINDVFEYGYLEREYLSMYNRLYIANKTMFKNQEAELQ